jgi:hypothetical protein
MTINEDLNPYPLSDGDIVFDGEKVSFSKAAGQEIQSRIKKKKGLNPTSIARKYNVNVLGSNISPKRITNALLGKNFQKQTLANIIMALMEHGVIQLKDPNLGQLLYPEAASSYTPTPETLNTAQNCAAVGGGGDSSTHSPLTTLHSAHIANNKGR